LNRKHADRKQAVDNKDLTVSDTIMVVPVMMMISIETNQ
jgi:hypothetical protein